MRIQEKLLKTSWASSTLQQLKAELDELSSCGSINIPKEPGGWWHQYVCPTHHTELLFDPAERDAYAFVCPHGCRMEGEAYRGAWLVFKHQSIARYAFQAAAVFAGTKEPAYADLAKQIIVSYAAQFPLYPVHPDAQPWMLKGRAFHQALTEAIWATTLLRAYLLLQDEEVAFDEEEHNKVAVFLSMLESSMTQYRHILIHEKKNAENNYTAWLNAALSCVYAVRGETGLLNELIEGEGGWRHHLSIGVKPDQFEFEGSTYYHIFVLRAYLISAEMAERFGIDLYQAEGEHGQSMKGMFDVLIGLSDDQGVLPALHDGPMARLPFAREIAEIMEIGLARYGQDQQPYISSSASSDQISCYGTLLGEAYRQMHGERHRSTLEALVYGEGDVELGQSMPVRQSLHLKDSGFVMGRVVGNELSFLADFGPHGGSHGHYDKLHVSLQYAGGAITPDFGMVPYGSSLRKEWFAETASHNTVSVGGASQAPHQGSCKHYSDEGDAVSVWIHSDAAYEGCTMDRHLHLTEGWLMDWFEVKLEKANTIDWWMHALHAPEALNGSWDRVEDMELAAGKAVETDAGAVQCGGYDRIRIQARFAPNPPISTDTSNASVAMACRYPLGQEASDSFLYHTVIRIPDGELYHIVTPGTSVDPSETLNGLLHRQEGLQGRFIHIYSIGEPVTVQWDMGSLDTSSKYSKLTVRSHKMEAVYELDTEQGLIVTRRD